MDHSRNMALNTLLSILRHPPTDDSDDNTVDYSTICEDIGERTQELAAVARSTLVGASSQEAASEILARSAFHAVRAVDSAGAATHMEAIMGTIEAYVTTTPTSATLLNLLHVVCT